MVWQGPYYWPGGTDRQNEEKNTHRELRESMRGRLSLCPPSMVGALSFPEPEAGGLAVVPKRIPVPPPGGSGILPPKRG